jgi:hypothetical protein
LIGASADGIILASNKLGKCDTDGDDFVQCIVNEIQWKKGKGEAIPVPGHGGP